MKKVLTGTVKSKTVYLGLAVTVLGYVQIHKEAIAAFIPTDFLGAVDMFLGVAIIIARFFTTESLTEKGTPLDDETDAGDHP